MKTIDIKGKKYVMVHERIKEFHSLYKNGMIHTDILKLEDNLVCIKAFVIPDISNKERFFTGHAFEKQDDKRSMVNETSFVENCETSAIGRALGLLGIGIDDSFASADEVQNAIKKQTIILEKKEDNKNIIGIVKSINSGTSSKGKKYFEYTIEDKFSGKELKIRNNFEKGKPGDILVFTDITSFGNTLYCFKIGNSKESNTPDDSHDIRERDAQIQSEEVPF